MSRDPDGRTRMSPLQAARHYWVFTILLSFIGLVVGVAGARTQPTSYTAEIRGAVGGQGIKAQSVPGFALASQQVASNYARYVTAAQFAKPLKDALGSRTAALISVNGSPIPESNLVRIFAVASDPDVATTAADAIAKALAAEVSGTDAQDQTKAALAEYERLSGAVAAAQTAVDIAKAQLDAALGTAKGVVNDSVLTAQTSYQTAAAALSPLQLQQQVAGNKYSDLATSGGAGSDLVLIGKAAVTFSDAKPRAQRFGLAGLALGFMIALMFARTLSRRRSKQATYQRRRATTVGAGIQ